uniref:Phosphatidylinositol-specific phospholipase C X domain-containing protein n=1 Tax=Percolomonas cosmopolitus TaxID=63605 RepID=A0A7S1PH87_9EUKA|mmetsp:Transcript_4912/g.18477  ORF Transcript_4912/g.18477 Transcript_4912/m.18477 type:complete len:566 (+) Transcript_4912:136-1833(+)|eukprot:CAMPEP_0117438242 /NCGR_PEP_ID=MMETSP0759-20121206/1952_1 /TAXON_ID=63605 /ORGANISM="Percolomonas cosmopolitus, Strain WS" /LENGTH=565 /DNA_ID=CAMNT_0005229927 /DNA_START=150 /DNA_END=1847 /DNA_ORIENTATION=+
MDVTAVDSHPLQADTSQDSSLTIHTQNDSNTCPHAQQGHTSSDHHITARQSPQIMAKIQKSAWMASFHSFPILSLTLPGAHNAACYSFSGFSIITSNAKCQAYSILKQLLIGVRYLDIRIRQVESNFWVGHSFQSKISLSEVLWQTRRFMETHPTEVVVFELDFEHHPVGKGGNVIDWKRVAYLIREVFHETTWKKVNMDKLVDLDVSTQQRLMEKHRAADTGKSFLPQVKFEKEYAKIKKHVVKELKERRRESRVKDKSLLESVYGEERHTFEIWWRYNCIRTHQMSEKSPSRKESSKSSSGSTSICESPRSSAPVDLSSFLKLSVPWEDRTKTIKEWLQNGKQMVLLNDHFTPQNAWPRSYRIKSWMHTRTPHIGDVKGLWHEFTEKHQESIIDEEKEVWTHLNCVLTLNMKSYFTKVLGRGGFEAYCRACNRALLDLLKWEKEEDKKYHFLDHIRLQIVDCDYVDEEICQLLIERNFRLLLKQDDSLVEVEAKSQEETYEEADETNKRRSLDKIVDTVSDEELAAIEDDIDPDQEEQEDEELQKAEGQLKEVLEDIEDETEK